MIFFEPLTIGEALSRLVQSDFPIRFSAYDGSAAGPADAEIGIDLLNERGMAYLLTAPGHLGLVRAYVSGDLLLTGVHPGDPYEALLLIYTGVQVKMPSPGDFIGFVRALGLPQLRPPPVPPQERPPRWRRSFSGLRHPSPRDAGLSSHHYDVSNSFYELVLGPSMEYTCGLYERPGSSLEEAQDAKFDLICRKLALQPGQRLLDVGCEWGGLVRHAAREYGVRSLGITMSLQQCEWAKAAIDREGLGDMVEVRHLDYRDVIEEGFDAVTSIGVTEHMGVHDYPAYFSHLRDRLKPGGRLLSHSVNRRDNRTREVGAFIDRYVFPDGELIGSGTLIAAAQDCGLEVQHTENLRQHAARTFADWSHNLVEHWDECVEEVGEATARVWGLHFAGSRFGFVDGAHELHQVLATRADESGPAEFPLRPDWIP